MFSVKSLMWEKPDITKPAVQTEYKHEVKGAYDAACGIDLLATLTLSRHRQRWSSSGGAFRNTTAQVRLAGVCAGRGPTLTLCPASQHAARGRSLAQLRHEPGQRAQDHAVSVRRLAAALSLSLADFACSKAPRFDSELAALKRYCLQLAHPNVTNFNEACPNNADWKYVQLPLVTDLPQSTTVAATPDTPRPAAGELPQETDETMAAAAPADAAAAASTAAESTEGAAPDAAELQRLSSTPTPPPSSSQSLSQATAQQPGTQADTPDVAGPPQAD
jgi:hypothetical protein